MEDWKVSEHGKWHLSIGLKNLGVKYGDTLHELDVEGSNRTVNEHAACLSVSSVAIHCVEQEMTPYRLVWNLMMKNPAEL